MNLKDKLQIIVNCHEQQTLQYHALGESIARLTAYGCIDAKEHWRDGKYLYLLYPMKGGLRKKKYIGSHPLRVKEAQEKLENYRRRLAFIHRQEKVSESLEEIEVVIDGLLEFCGKFDLSAKFANVGYKKARCTADACTQ